MNAASRPGPLEFDVPPELEAHEPPEARGLARDEVRMMVAHREDGAIVHARFRDLPTFLVPGDLLVVNNSGTFPAALVAQREDGTRLEFHLSTPLPSGSGPVDPTARPDGRAQVWVVELRTMIDEGTGSRSFREARSGERLALPAEAVAEIMEPYPPNCGDPDAPRDEGEPRSRLWTALLWIPTALGPYLERYGHPIRYGYVGREWPVSYYQTVFAVEAGSAEMPSAGRAFTPEIVTELIARGVDVAPITLHAGVSSLEEHERPPAEFFRVPPDTARRVNAALGGGNRVIAVGTTVVRALESAVEGGGPVRPAEGWTEILVSPDRGVRVVSGLLSGWHEPRASHLLMLEAVGGRDLLTRSYDEAVRDGYLWHEFGDLLLILP